MNGANGGGPRDSKLADWREWTGAGFERLPVVAHLVQAQLPESWENRIPDFDNARFRRQPNQSGGGAKLLPLHLSLILT